MKVIVTFYLLVTASLSICQTISGNVKFQSDRKNYTWVFTNVNDVRIECDSLGHFQFNKIENIDTLDIYPIPMFISVKIYNFPASFDIVNLIDIPFFSTIDRNMPMIHFRTKRAARKYFKKSNKQEDLDREVLKKRISDYRFVWNEREYDLELNEHDDSYTILINLAQ